jgi:endonuclease/exonuclease/phosphatase family metal-dependent hydrolase
MILAGMAALVLSCGPAQEEVAPITGQQEQAVATTQKYNIWHWNIAGNTLHGGSTTDGLIDIIANSIVGNGAHFVTLNEVCRNQYDALIAALRSRGWPVDTTNFARFVTTRAASTGVCQNYAYGNALFSKNPLGTSENITLTDAHPSEHRKLLCAPLASLPHMRICVTHITTDPNYLGTQLTEVRTKLDQYIAAGDTVILAGDLNAEPNYAGLNLYYSSSVNTTVNSNNSGSYRELDDADGANCPGHGEATFGSTGGGCGTGRKLDYVFVPQSRLAGAYELDSHAIPTCSGSPCSDHRMIEGSVTVTVQ